MNNQKELFERFRNLHPHLQRKPKLSQRDRDLVLDRAIDREKDRKIDREIMIIERGRDLVPGHVTVIADRDQGHVIMIAIVGSDQGHVTGKDRDRGTASDRGAVKDITENRGHQRGVTRGHLEVIEGHL